MESVAVKSNTAPQNQLVTSRGLIKFILFSIITLGIYDIVMFCIMSSEINTVASKHDNKKTMNFALIFFFFSWLTLGIAPLVWITRFCGRIGAELNRRDLGYSFGAGSFWIWGVLGSIIFVGPFVFIHKLTKAMNIMNADYNAKG